MKTLWNIWWNKWTWPLKLGSAIVLIIVLGLVIGFFKSCFTRTPKLNQQEIIKAQQAIAKEDRKEMIEVLATSEAREQVADETAVNAKAATANAIAESKQKWSEASNDEMAAELERRAKESQ